VAPLLGGAAAAVFLASLIASGISSATVGTMAGQLIMQGFVGIRIPVWLRRAVTMTPAFVVVGLGVNATSALIISQVLLSLTLPIPMTALLIFTAHPDVMGELVNGRVTTVLAALAATIVLVLNLVLLLQSAGLAF
jgi:manganese transport protein